MTSKELHKLSRRELLQLLLAQSEEAEETSRQLKDTAAELELMTANYERLRKRLDMKDAQIADLRATIQRERTKREIELNDAGNIAEAALRLNGVFEAAQKAAEQYIYNMQKRLEDLEKGAGDQDAPAEEPASEAPAQPETQGEAQPPEAEAQPEAPEGAGPEEQPSDSGAGEPSGGGEQESPEAGGGEETN